VCHAAGLPEDRSAVLGGVLADDDADAPPFTKSSTTRRATARRARSIINLDILSKFIARPRMLPSVIGSIGWSKRAIQL
jgi:hypothetical protein